MEGGLIEGGEPNIVIAPHPVILQTTNAVQVVTTSSATATRMHLPPQQRRRTCRLCKRPGSECPGAQNRSSCTAPASALPTRFGDVVIDSDTRVISRAFKTPKRASCRNCGKTNTAEDKANGTGCPAATKGNPKDNCPLYVHGV